MKYVAVFLFLMIGGVHAQSKNSNASAIETHRVFAKDEEAYIEKWFSELDAEMNLNAETNHKYQQILNDYGEKMSALGYKKTFSKAQVLQAFKQLVREQNSKVKLLLNEDQFKIHFRKYKILTWSVSDRLYQQ
ncbi:hypothetical protein ABN763_16660 [Spongiivirga sp. MCCC 1A20706]|uniref:hypothetical protein n=1 Tax=Spongiivirga sp. MCCC 1A20706 TaxID=3160963 RepID=UPI003977B14B